jgi:pSer/pThr/pTyr-binding forkhead associated (FHA) protein
LSGPDIFISYARSDEEMARLVALAFEQEGFNVWWDAALHSGETFDEVIEKELRAAKAVVVLWSPRSVSSRWVRAEATLADRNRTLAPAIIEPCDRPIIFELTHTVDLSAWDGNTADPVWQAYLYDIRRLIGERVEGQVGSGASPKSASSRPISRARAAPPPPQQQPEGPSMESLMSAISSLQQALHHQSGGQASSPPPVAAPAPPPPPPPPPPPARVPEVAEDDDESEATQIYTGADVYAMIEGDELHCLEMLVEGTVEQRFVVGPLGMKIGRTPPADVVLGDGKVSRSHCTLELKDGLLYVTDLKSTNGTYVDGKRVDGSAILPVGATLMVGRFALVHEVRTRAELL